MESFRQIKTQFQEIKYIYFHTDYVPNLLWLKDNLKKSRKIVLNYDH